MCNQSDSDLKIQQSLSLFLSLFVPLSPLLFALWSVLYLSRHRSDGVGTSPLIGSDNELLALIDWFMLIWLTFDFAVHSPIPRLRRGGPEQQSCRSLTGPIKARLHTIIWLIRGGLLIWRHKIVNLRSVIGFIWMAGLKINRGFEFKINNSTHGDKAVVVRGGGVHCRTMADGAFNVCDETHSYSGINCF